MTQKETEDLLMPEAVLKTRLGPRQLDELLNKSHLNPIPTDEEIEDNILFNKFSRIVEID